MQKSRHLNYYEFQINIYVISKDTFDLLSGRVGALELADGALEQPAVEGVLVAGQVVPRHPLVRHRRAQVPQCGRVQRALLVGAGDVGDQLEAPRGRGPPQGALGVLVQAVEAALDCVVAPALDDFEVAVWRLTFSISMSQDPNKSPNITILGI